MLTLGLESSILERVVIPSTRNPCDDSVANIQLLPNSVIIPSKNSCRYYRDRLFRVKKRHPSVRKKRDSTLRDSRTHARPVGGARDKKYRFWNKVSESIYFVVGGHCP